MKWSLRLARVSGIDIRVHATFLIVVLVGAFDAQRHYGPAGFWFGALVICALFVCVTLHELGHSLVAQRFGVGVKEIVLLPIGGMAQLKSEPKKPRHELLIAIAGPLVNVVIAAILFALLRPGSAAEFEAAFATPSLRAFGSTLLFLNVTMALFNMIPALPMDGGRVLRAILASFMGKPRATRIAAGVGQLVALGFVVIAFEKSQPLLGLIGAFVFFAAGQERAFQAASAVLGQLRAGEVCDPDATAFSPSDHLGGVLDQLLRSHQAAFVVLHGKDMIGVVTRDDVLRATPVLGPNGVVSQIMRRDTPVVSAEMPLDQLRAVLGEARGPVVVSGPEGVLGVLTSEDLARVAMVMQELLRRGLSRPLPSPAPEA